MPSLQLDAAATYDLDTKRALARRLGEVYAEVMLVDPRRITVVVRDLGPGGVWRCTDDEPEPAALLMLDVRRGRDADTRAELCRRLLDACGAITGLDPGGVKVEFTQHAGDEMYHPQLGGWGGEWRPETG